MAESFGNYSWGRNGGQPRHLLAYRIGLKVYRKFQNLGWENEIFSWRMFRSLALTAKKSFGPLESSDDLSTSAEGISLHVPLAVEASKSTDKSQPSSVGRPFLLLEKRSGNFTANLLPWTRRWLDRMFFWQRVTEWSWDVCTYVEKEVKKAFNEKGKCWSFNVVNYFTYCIERR